MSPFLRTKSNIERLIFKQFSREELLTNWFSIASLMTLKNETIRLIFRFKFIPREPNF